MNVIPTVSWSTDDSYDFCFRGIETGSTVAISTLGCLRNKDSRELFMEGYEEMRLQLKPEKILLYGKYPTNIRYGEGVIHIENQRLKKMMEGE